MATQPPPTNLPLFYNNLQPLSSTACTPSSRPAPRDKRALSRQRPRDPADDRRVRHRPAHYPDRLLGRRQSGAAGADGPQRGRQRLRRRRGQAAQPDLRAGLCPPLSLSCSPGSTRAPRSCRSASIRRATWSASSRTASRCSTTTSRARRLNAILKFCEEFEIAGPAHQRLRQGAEGARPADRRRGRDPAGRRRAALHLSRLPDGRRGEAARAARRQAAQDQPERHPAADHRPSLLAAADPRDFRPAGAAGQGAGAAPPRRPVAGPG